MKKWLLLAGLLFMLNRQVHAQLDATPATELVATLQQGVSGADKVQVLLQLIVYYYFDHTGAQPDLDKMWFYLEQAQQVNKGAQAAKWQNEIDCYRGKYYWATGDKKRARACFDKIGRDIANSGNLATQALNWHKLGCNIRNLDTAGLTRNICFRNEVVLYYKMGDTEKAVEREKDFADTHMKQGKLELAETELFAVLEKYKAIGYRRLHYTYNLLSCVNSLKGNYNTALQYALLAMESMQKTGDSIALLNFYSHLASMYDDVGQEEKSLEIYKIAFDRPYAKPIGYYVLRDAGEYARILIKLHRLREAFKFFTDFIKKYPPGDTYGKAVVARTMAYFYRCSGNEVQERRYIREMIALVPLLLKNNDITQDVAYDLGRYFLSKGDFANASAQFKHALAEASYANYVYRKKDIYLMLFKTDSALGNYVSAIQHLNLHSKLKDSIFTVVKNRQLQEVQIKYETEKKDKDLMFKDSNIQLLTRESQLRLTTLQAEKRNANMALICVVMLIVLLALGYNRYKLKQKNNTQLEEQQKKIQEKNSYLQHLLEEKEWLVKEIHHRVKNNFHIVMGLLGTQSGYLRNREAIAAMAESQQRIHAMSLIHQKLYQSENMSDLNMEDYIHELVDYLKDALNTGRRILFHFQLDRISLGVYHAVPVGLIINEIITNAVKYAFPENRNGNIAISFTRDAANENKILLVVKDDGAGLPEGFKKSSNGSMGMNLMKGLARDIDGAFCIESSEGTTVSMAFTYQRDILKEHTTMKEIHDMV